MTTTGVFIVHGARKPFARMAGIQQWTSVLRNYLLSQGFSPVRVFIWSGGFLRSHGRTVHKDCALHLQKMWEDVVAQVGSFSILAKSQGALVAEGALRYLDQAGSDIEINTLLRIATPDFRVAPHVPRVRRIIDLTSRMDRLYQKGLILNRLAVREKSAHTSAVTITKYYTDNFSHHDFNYNKTIILDGESVALPVFDLYAGFLSGAR